MTNLSRRRLLAAGAAGSAALVAGALPSLAAAATPAPAPVDDDLAYLQIASATKLVTIALYEQAQKTAGLLDGRSSGLVAQMAADDAAHKVALDVVLDTDAPTSDSYDVKLPAAALRSVAGVSRTGRYLEGIVVGTLLGGSPTVIDRPTLFLLMRVLAGDAEHLGSLHALAGPVPTAGHLPNGMTVEVAADALDRFLIAAEPTGLRFSKTLRRHAR